MGIVEIAPNTTQVTGFYLPHPLSVRKEAETTKVCVAYKESVRKNQTAPSLNDVLETGPSSHNLIWNITLKTWLFNPLQRSFSGVFFKSFCEFVLVMKIEMLSDTLLGKNPY